MTTDTSTSNNVTTPTETISSPSASAPSTVQLSLSRVSPSSIASNVSQTLTLSGSGFVHANVGSVLIGTIRMTNFQVVDDNTIQLNVAANQFVAGSYDVTVEGASNLTSSLSPGLTVTRAPVSSATPLR